MWRRTSLVAQWLRLYAPNAGGLTSIPDQGTRSHRLQQRVCMPQRKILCDTTNTWWSQKKKKNEEDLPGEEGGETGESVCKALEARETVESWGEPWYSEEECLFYAMEILSCKGLGEEGASSHLQSWKGGILIAFLATGKWAHDQAWLVGYFCPGLRPLREREKWSVTACSWRGESRRSV